MEHKKVLMFGWEFPPYNSGGLGVACWGLTRALVSAGVDVTFVLPKSFPLEDSHCEIIFADTTLGALKLKPIQTGLTPYLTASEYARAKGKSGQYGHTLLDEVLRYAELAREIALEEDFDIIHAHDWLSFLAGIEAKKVSGKPLVVHVHATEFDRVGSGSVNPFVYDVEQEGMEKADKIIAVSNFTKDLLISNYDIPASKIRVIHNGIDENDFKEKNSIPVYLQKLKEEGNKIILFVGRLTLQKGPDYFVKTAKKVLEHYKKAYFVVIGSGDMEGRMLEEVSREGLSERFIFAGFLRDGLRDSVYASSDIYVMPSVSEPFGITPLEAAMQNVPTLISRNAGVGEVLTHALKADFWDVDEMASKIIAVLEHPALQKTLGENSRAQIKNVNWKNAAEKCIILYNEL
jgi:glycosyltransferase involved in cell wall biosynthesis